MKERKSNLELLRIVAILMVITVHYLLYMRNGEGKEIYTYLNTQNYNLMCVLESFFVIGVNLFILITGYFMIEKKVVNINKITKLVFSTIFYSVIFFIVAIKLNVINFSIKEFIKAIMSTLIYEEYWFIKLYCVLFCLIPFINLGLNKMDKNMYKSLIVIGTIFFSLPNSFLPYSFCSSVSVKK